MFENRKRQQTITTVGHFDFLNLRSTPPSSLLFLYASVQQHKKYRPVVFACFHGQPENLFIIILISQVKIYAVENAPKKPS
ncbi:MAG: hypothetical protein D3909_11860 [Candidatus Electrothrix sp. ATG1]|nr:hypothetical protein [Candidatus Electrothrix sp. ATG1]MCI5210937.1 hypothetical protein [Candidatus Electrothrix sp. ATG2]